MKMIEQRLCYKFPLPSGLILELRDEESGEWVENLVKEVAVAKEKDLQLSRILHEMAGAVSLCWDPQPVGNFESTLACEFVAKAIEELRSIGR